MAALPPSVDRHLPLPGISEEGFEQTFAKIQGDAGQEWYRPLFTRHATLWDAREAAAASGRPIFIWSMNGHPLGCT